VIIPHDWFISSAGRFYRPFGGSSVVASAWPAHATVPINEELASVLEQTDAMTASQPVTETLSGGAS